MAARSAGPLLLGLGLLACALAPRALAQPELRPLPQARLRLAPGAIGASVELEAARRLPGLVSGIEQGQGWPRTVQLGEAELVLALPAGAERSPWLLVVELEPGRAPSAGALVLLGRSAPAGPPRQLAALGLGAGPPGPWRVAVPAGQRTLQLRLRAQSAAGPLPALGRVRLYRLDPQGRRNDYWLFLGASLTAAGIGDGEPFARAIRVRYPGYEPYVANEAVSGWTAGRLRRELPAILERHPHARYVAIHIGGNDVSAHRPYPGGAEALERELTAILRTVQRAGKVPVLARLSYRAYRAQAGKPAVPPAANGSGPYVTAIYDPLIAQYCPAFYDRTAGRGLVDLYGYFEAHPELLGADGVHLRRAGYERWPELWAETAGAVVYGAR